MKKKVVLTLLLLVLLAVLVPVSGLLAAQLPDYKPVDVGPEIRKWDASPAHIQGSPRDLASEPAAAAAANAAIEDCILDTKTWLSLNDYAGSYFFTTFNKIAETAGSELWLQANLSWPAGDPRETPVVTCEQAEYLLSEFDNNMYPTETSFFGTPDLHDGSNSLLEAWGYFPPGYYGDPDGKQVVLVSNIRDDSYYDYTYPNYIAGFYSPSFEAYFDRNIMSIDAYDWANRVGPDGGRPYLYESVFAHEYQHLLHDDYDSDEESWVNEGLSMFAEFLTGYVIDDDAYSTFQRLPENSLTWWGDQGGREIVADYGLAMLYQMHLYEKFGPEFIQAEFLNQENSIAGVNSTLAAFNIQQDFADTYHDVAVAVLLDSEKANSRWGYDLLDVGIDIGVPGAPNPEAYDTPGAPPWGADYIYLDYTAGDVATLHFDGVDSFVAPTPWTSDGDVLFSGSSALADNWAIFPATGGGTLTFDTYWDIEDYWDFGLVQVSTDGGYTWTSLANDYTTSEHDPNAHPNIIANLPGLTGWSCYYAADPCWINLSYDLSAYAGQDVLLAFRYMTDWATEYEGWFIDNVYVDGVLISDGSDASVFKSYTELFPVDQDFTVQLVGVKQRPNGPNIQVTSMKLDDATEEGYFVLNDKFEGSDYVVMLVTFDAPEGTMYYADYSYELLP